MDVAELSTELATLRIQQQVQIKVAKGANESIEAVAMKLLEGIAASAPPAPPSSCCGLHVVA
jgi:hypothetical protein